MAGGLRPGRIYIQIESSSVYDQHVCGGPSNQTPFQMCGCTYMDMKELWHYRKTYKIIYSREINWGRTFLNRDCILVSLPLQHTCAPAEVSSHPSSSFLDQHFLGSLGSGYAKNPNELHDLSARSLNVTFNTHSAQPLVNIVCFIEVTDW